MQAIARGTAVVAGSMENLCNIVVNVGNNLDATLPPPSPGPALGRVNPDGINALLPPRQFEQARKHVERIDSILNDLSRGITEAAGKNFRGTNTDVRIASLGEKLTSLRNKWATGELSGSSRWLKFGTPVASWQRAEGERIVKKTMATIGKNAKDDAYRDRAESGAAFDLYMRLGSLRSMKL